MKSTYRDGHPTISPIWSFSMMMMMTRRCRTSSSNVKRPEISDAAFAQAIEQACGNRASLGARYCGVVAGLTRRLLRFDKYPPGERGRNHLTDIPVSYGNPPEWRFYKNAAGQDLAAVPREELRAAIRKCHQTLWEGGRRSPIAAFGEFSKLVFIKHRDEKDLDRPDGQPYAFQRRDGETAEQLAARINHLYDKEQQLEPDVFTDHIGVEPPILAQCVEHLEGISLDRTELDTKGVAFEEFMGGFFKGDFGQYSPSRTHRLLRGNAGPQAHRPGSGPSLRLRRVPAVCP